MKVVIVAMLTIHAFIRLIGVGKAYNLNNVRRWSKTFSKQQSKIRSRVQILLWLLAFLLFLMASIALIGDRIWWSIPAIAGIIISQTLIISQWNDAKWGSILNAVIFVVALISMAEWKSLRDFSVEIKKMFSTAIQVGYPHPIQGNEDWLSQATERKV